jgi:phosphohistidine phosphatase
MKEIIIIRHAKTEVIHTGISDFERSLVKRGINDSNLMADILIKKKIQIDLFISSPANRAIETASILASKYTYPIGKIVQEDYLYGYFPASRFLQKIAGLDKKIRCIAVIGHNPVLEDLVEELSGQYQDHLPTAGVIGISFSVNTWDEISTGTGKITLLEYPRFYK